MASAGAVFRSVVSVQISGKVSRLASQISDLQRKSAVKRSLICLYLALIGEISGKISLDRHLARFLRLSLRRLRT
jgi:hypothetical protein